MRESAAPILAPKLTPNIVASMSFGQAISVSPLALATGMSAILNGGVYGPLTLTPLAAGQAPAAGRQVIQPATSRTMLDLMRLNVVEGTGTKADIPGLRVGGKTGTATKLVGGHYVEGKNVANLASFAAVFPTDGALGRRPLLGADHAGPAQADARPTAASPRAALTAAPTAGRVIERIAPFLGVAASSSRRIWPQTGGRPQAPRRRRPVSAAPPFRPGPPRPGHSIPRSPASPPTAAR